MGYNTTVVVLNDALHEIRSDKEFGAKLYDAALTVNRGKPVDVSAGCRCNAATVIESHHADGMHAVLIGGNYGEDLGWVGGYSLDTDNEDHRVTLLRSLADRLGFTIAIKKKVSK
jgi:hypothetical protein